MRTLRRLTADWDFWLIWSLVASTALAFALALSGTLDAIQRAMLP